MTETDSAARKLAEAATASVLDGDDAYRRLGMTLTEVDRDHAVIEMLVRDDMLNGVDVGHGGFVFCLADTVCAVVSNSRNQKAVLQSASITLTAPAHVGDLLTASGCRSAGEGRVGVIDATVTNQNGETVALFRGSTYEIRGAHVNEGGD